MASGLSEPPGLAAAWDGPPDADAAAALAALEPADLDDLSLVESLAAWERVAAWAQAGSARMLAELLERARGSAQHEFVVDEIAARLGLSRYAAAQHVTVAHGAHAMPEVSDVMAAGLADRRKAEALVSTGRMPDEVRRDVVRSMRPELEHLTVRQIRDRLRRAEIAADPDGVEDRRRRARRERSVTLEPVDDAMAYLTAYLPADEAARAFAVIDHAALAQRRTRGEERRLDECRADALVALATGRMTVGAPAEADLGADRTAGTDRAAGTDRLAGADSSGWAGGNAGSGMSGMSGMSGASGAGARAPFAGAARPVQVTIAASTLLGTDDLPAILAGYGPIPATVARTLATDPDATWQRILTDPVSGVLTDRTSRSYRPSPRLRAAVAARDATCTFPGCQVPARAADLDHIEPFDPRSDRSQTVGDNLHALCRTHHRAKTVGGWRVARDPMSGVTTWTAPSGGRYRRDPHVADPARPPGNGEPADGGRPSDAARPADGGRPSDGGRSADSAQPTDRARPPGAARPPDDGTPPPF